MGKSKLKVSVFFAVASLVPSLSTASPIDDPTIWLNHLNDDLIPFYDTSKRDPAVQNGAFPTRLCNDGSLVQPGVSCTGVPPSQSNKLDPAIVSQSRQIFANSVAFHMTGEAEYLELAKKGIDYQIDNLYDPTTKLYASSYSPVTDTRSATANAQKQAYGLLGPSFYYYLTGDTDVYSHINTVADSIADSFRDPATGGYVPTVGADQADSPIAQTLDQLNTYLTLMSLQAPVGDQVEFQNLAHQTATYLRTEHFDPTTGLIKTRSSDPNGSGTDYGHSIKTYWFMDQIGQITGDNELSSFASGQGKELLDLAFQDASGAWAKGQNNAGEQSFNTDWWIFAELDQYAHSLALNDASLRDNVDAALTYWLTNYVDQTDTGIFANVDVQSGLANASASKHWEWKSGFHSFEHALVSFAASTGIAGNDLTLYFGQNAPTYLDGQLAYGFTGDLVSSQGLGLLFSNDEVTAATYSNVQFASIAAVPLPQSAAFLLGALSLLGAAKRSKRR